MGAGYTRQTLRGYPHLIPSHFVEIVCHRKRCTTGGVHLSGVVHFMDRRLKFSVALHLLCNGLERLAKEVDPF